MNQHYYLSIDQNRRPGIVGLEFASDQEACTKQSGPVFARNNANVDLFAEPFQAGGENLCDVHISLTDRMKGLFPDQFEIVLLDEGAGQKKRAVEAGIDDTVNFGAVNEPDPDNWLEILVDLTRLCDVRTPR
jgi:hypothetical protein